MSNKRKIGVVILSVLKVIVPIGVCVAVLGMIVSITTRQKNVEAENAFASAENVQEITLTAVPEPIKENAYQEVNDFILEYYQALADGNKQVIKNHRDSTTDKELIKYEKKSEYIEKYENITCYTKNGLQTGAYFVFVAYDIKLVGIDTKAPGLNSWYVYPDSTGKLVISGDSNAEITEALKATSLEDDVADIFAKVNVKFKEVIASDDNLKTFLEEIDEKIDASVNEEIAKLEAENLISTEEGTSEQSTESEVKVSQIVNQEVRATDTVNVRSSDSETADKIGKAPKGMTLTRIEEKLNGWSKVIFEGKEAYIKSDYLELVAAEANADSIGVIKAKSNVNVRSKADQTSDRIGVAQSGNVYNLLEDLGEWYKIDYKGKEGYVKSEFFDR